MDIKKKLTNPFALVAQGFGLGAVLFFATVPSEPDSTNARTATQSAALPENIGA